MAFTYSVTGPVGSQTLEITSLSTVYISVSSNNVVLSDTLGGATVNAGALINFGVGGLPSQTFFEGSATANVVPLSAALIDPIFLNKYADGAILQANAATVGDGWSNVLNDLDPFADESIQSLALTSAQFSALSDTNVRDLDPLLSNAAGGLATVSAVAQAAGLTIDASRFQDASFNLVGGTGGDTLIGGAGNDSISGAIGTAGDYIDGGNGNDTIVGGSLADQILGGAGSDNITAGSGNDTISGGDGNDIIHGGFSNDNISGGDGNDFLYGDTGNDIILGGAGNDYLLGDSGSVTLTGGAGDDAFVTAYGTATVQDLGDGADTLDVGINTTSVAALVVDNWTATSATINRGAAGVTLTVVNDVDVNLNQALGTSGYTVTAAANSDSSIIAGSYGNDNIAGGSGADVLRGYYGNDTISGGVGDDMIYGGQGANSLNGGAGTDTFVLNGSTDTVTSLDGADVLVVNGAATVVNANVGATWVATADTQNFSAGAVTLTLANGVGIDMRAATGDHGYTINASGAGTAANIFGSQYNDVIIGTSAADIIRAAAGDDSILGGSGNDLIFGGYGADTFHVDAGTDSINDLGRGADSLIVDAGAGVTATVVSDWTATSVTVNNSSSVITLNLNDGVNVNLSAATATAGGYTINAANNANGSTIVGSTNNDIISGGSGNDVLRGGFGNDTIVAGVGDDVLFGGAGNNSLVGGLGADTFNLLGTNTVTDLGLGDDVLTVTGATSVVNARVAANWTATEATSHSDAGVVTLTLANDVDVNLRAATGDHGYILTASGNTAHSDIVGSNYADSIFGSAVSDELRGALGDDTLNGGAGNDVLFGGGGADLFQVASGADTIRDLGLGADDLTVAASQSVIANVVSDWVATAVTSNANAATLALNDGVNVDLDLATGANGFTISAVNNTQDSIMVGSTNNDIIRGGNGNDLIEGNVGADMLSGGAGVDTFVYETGSTGVSSAAAGDLITDLSLNDLISTGIADITDADVLIADGTIQTNFSDFATAAQAAFAAGNDVYVAYNQAASGDALVAINNNGGVTFTTGDSLITLVGVNQASEISASNFVA